MMDGIGMMIRSMKMLSEHDVRMKVRESKHFPPRIRVPDASLVSMAGRLQAYLTGAHCRMLPRVVPMP
jgi:hypothetical protein